MGSEPTPLSGVVVSKNHRPGWIEMVPVGKVIVPIRRPERWDVVIQPDGTTGDNDRQLVSVSQETWDRLEVGGVWRTANAGN